MPLSLIARKAVKSRVVVTSKRFATNSVREPALTLDFEEFPDWESANAKLKPEKTIEELDKTILAKTIPERSAKSIVAPTPSPYITSPPKCDLTAAQKANLSKVEAIICDTVPSPAILKATNGTVVIPAGSGVENKYCNPHANYVAESMFGLKRNSNNKLVTSFPGLKVTFIGTLLCTGSGYWPNLVASLNQATAMATANPKIKYVVNWSIGGTYHPQAEVEALNQLSSLPNVTVCVPIGNSEIPSDWCTLPYFQKNPNIVLVGGTQEGDKKYAKSNWGSCCKFYFPAVFKSVVSGKVIAGDSFASPGVGNEFLRQYLMKPTATREQALEFLIAQTDLITFTTWNGVVIPMNVMPKAKRCNLMAG